MSMSMSMRPTLTQRMAQHQSLTMEQRQKLSVHQTMMQIGLVAALRDERYQPVGDCPSCGRKLQPNEILAGFTADVNDFTTLCTGCNRRFEPKLICFGEASRIEIPFYCNVQARNQLKEAAHLSPAEIARQHPGPYRSAIVHYGTLAAMFQTIGVTYDQQELEGWQAKVQPFLGRLPDTVIAKCLNVKVEVVRKMRKDQRIGSYTKRKGLKEAQETPATTEE